MAELTQVAWRQDKRCRDSGQISTPALASPCGEGEGTRALLFQRWMLYNDAADNPLSWKTYS